MAKILSGILSPVSGKVSGVVGGSWKGISYLRGYAIPANPNTIPQQDQRGKFRSARLLAALLLNTVVQKFWDFFAHQQSGYNMFISKNLLLMASETDWINSIVSYGKLEPNAIGTGVYDVITGIVEISYDEETFSNGLATDKVVGVVFDSVNQICFVNDAVAVRSDTSLEVNVGTGRTAADMFAYTFSYRNLDTKQFIVSTSSVVGCTI